MSTDTQALLDFDPLSVAEKITRKSYKDDDATMALGLSMHIDVNARKRDALAAAGDTHHGTAFTDTLRIYQDEGFAVVLEEDFEGRYAAERLVLLWTPGALALVESFTWGVGDEPRATTNHNRLYMNWRGDGWRMGMSGRSVAGVWVGDKDMREGTRHYLARLRSEGEFVSPWIERPFLWLKHYNDQADYSEANAARIAQLPADVQAAIGPSDE